VSTTDCIRTLPTPRHIVPKAFRASRTAAEAGALPLFDSSIPHRPTSMQDGAGYRLNEVPHPQERFAFGMSKWNPPPISCPV